MTSPLRRRVVALGAATAALLTAAGAAGATPMLEAVRVASRPVIDGALDDGAWTEVAVGRDFHVRYPADDGVPTEPTEVRVVYDQDAVYVGITAHDAHPDQIRALLTRRDEDSTSDWLSVGIDSLGDRRTSFVFAISAAGVQRDYKIVDDRQVDDGWDAVWESAVRRGDDGWTAELRIPLSQLRFAARDQEWGMQVTRVLARTGEESVWSPSPHTDRRLVSRYGRLAGLRALRAPRDLELRPYAVLGGELRDVDPALRDDLGPRWSVGADARYGLGAGLVLTAAINPDFGQVEADPSEINLTDSELFFPERRALFQEAAELFDATLAGDETLFYSRRIGAAPHGEPGPDAVAAEAPDASTILGAAKLSGRTASGWSIGVLDAVGAPERARVVREDGSRGEDPVEPLTNFGVVRVRKTLGREDTTLGGIVTTVHRRLDDPAFELLHRDAYVAGVDGAVGFGDGSWRLSGLVAGTRVAGSAAAIARTQRSSVRYWQRPDATHVAVDPARTALLGWGGTLALEHSGAGGWSGELRSQLSSPGFEPNDLGFLQLADAATHALTVRWDGGGDGAISAYTLSGTVQAIHDFEPRLHAWTAGGEADVTFA
ncbi:MAG: carbohydrate binding family 9 domain-containing protein, partial [Myxococcales bacterium]|nr:carbohydrate binding family 9 domain-containing protein [Myxococcales bacterium]